MNSIERVKAAIHFKGPDRAPVWRVSSGDVFTLAAIPSKTWNPGYSINEQGMFPYVGGIDQAIQFGIYKWKRPDWAKAPEYKKFLTIAREEVDEFGAIWNRDDHNGSIGHPGRPSLSDWADLDAYLDQYSPDARDKSRYSFFVKLSRLFGRNKYRMAILGTQGPFTITSAIRGFENFMMDHALNPNELRRLLDHITKFYVDQVEAWVEFGGKPHGFLIYDDLADQRHPFISPKMFEEFYKPVFKTIFDKVHDLGCDIHLHSCGKIDPLLPYLIDWGVDALELDSPRTVGYPDFEPFRGNIMLWGCVNIQSTYSTGTPDECQREAWHMVRNLGTPEGGFGAYFYPQPHHINVNKQNIKAFAQGMKKYSVYRKIPANWWTSPVPKEWKDDVVPMLPG